MIVVRSFRCRVGRPESSVNWVALDRSSDPIGRLLPQLRTRTVTLLLEGRAVTGKLVRLRPVTLASPEGEVIVVRLKAIQAVIF
jgi:hypothetical protein